MDIKLHKINKAAFPRACFTPALQSLYAVQCTFYKDRTPMAVSKIMHTNHIMLFHSVKNNYWQKTAVS